MSTYYVSTSGSDSNDGSSESPWLTIGQAIDSAYAGDIVNIASGTYYEQLWTTRSGTSTSPIQFIGATDTYGNPATIVDGSTTVSGTTWIAAPEVHADCYKTTDLTRPQLITLSGNVIPQLSTAVSGTLPGNILYSSGDYAYETDLGGTVNVYDTVGVVYAISDDYATTYIRFGDGKDPTTENISLRHCPNFNPTLYVYDDDYLTFKNLELRGCLYGVNYRWCKGVTLDNIKFPHGDFRVRFLEDTEDCTLKNCSLYSETMPGIKYGAWHSGSAESDTELNLKCFGYRLSKNIVGGGTSSDNGVYYYSNGSNITIENCDFSWLAIGLTGHDCENVIITGSSFLRCSSLGVTIDYGVTATIGGCTFCDCNAPLRFQNMEWATARSASFSNCSVENPKDVGRLIYLHWGPSAPGEGFTNPVASYDNCDFIGGAELVRFGLWSASDRDGGIPGFSFTNCEIKTPTFAYASSTFHSDETQIGTFSNNTVCTINFDRGIPAFIPSASLYFENLPSSSYTYHVAPTGLDSYAGTQTAPFATIDKAKDMSEAGDSIYVFAGEYKELNTFSISGSSESLITFTGQTGSAGENLVTINGSTSDGNELTWLAAPEIHPNCYKAAVAQKPWGWLIDDKWAPIMYSMEEGESSLPGYPDVTNRSVLTSSGEYYYPTLLAEDDVAVYENVAVIIGHTGSNVYMRFGDGSHPNTHKLEYCSYTGTTLYIRGSFLTFSHFNVRGGKNTIFFSSADAHDSIVEYCTASQAERRISIETNAYNNIVRYCESYPDWIGSAPFGAWGDSEELTPWNTEAPFSNTVRHQRAFMYTYFKYLIGENNNKNTSVFINQVGLNNEIHDCYLHDSNEGIYAFNMDSAKIHDNNITNQSSVGIIVAEGSFNTEIYNNTFNDSNVNVRVHRLGHLTHRTVKIYNNTITQYYDLGLNVKFHYNDATKPEEPEYLDPVVEISDNFISGGVSAFHTDWSLAAEYGGYPGFTIVRNTTVNCPKQVYGNTAFHTHGEYFGSYDDNKAYRVPYTHIEGTVPAWLDSNNVVYPVRPSSSGSFDDAKTKAYTRAIRETQK